MYIHICVSRVDCVGFWFCIWLTWSFFHSWTCTKRGNTHTASLPCLVCGSGQVRKRTLSLLYPVSNQNEYPERLILQTNLLTLLTPITERRQHQGLGLYTIHDVHKLRRTFRYFTFINTQSSLHLTATLLVRHAWTSWFITCGRMRRRRCSMTAMMARVVGWDMGFHPTWWSNTSLRQCRSVRMFLWVNAFLQLWYLRSKIGHCSFLQKILLLLNYYLPFLVKQKKWKKISGSQPLRTGPSKPLGTKHS